MSFNIIDTKAIDRSKTVKNEYGDSLPQLALSDLEREYQGWYKTGDVAYIDAMVSLLAKHNAPITGDILKLVGQLASKRLNQHIPSNKKRIVELKLRCEEDKRKEDSFKLILKNNIGSTYILEIFVLVEVCDMTASKAYNYVAARLHNNREVRTMLMPFKKKHSTYVEFIADKPRSSISVGRCYREWKKGQDYDFLMANIDLYLGQLYPDMTTTDIKNSLVGDIDLTDNKYSHLVNPVDKEYEF